MVLRAWRYDSYGGLTLVVGPGYVIEVVGRSVPGQVSDCTCSCDHACYCRRNTEHDAHLVVKVKDAEDHCDRICKKGNDKYENPSRSRMKANRDQSFDVASFRSVYAVRHNMTKSTVMVIEINARWRARLLNSIKHSGSWAF